MLFINHHCTCESKHKLSSIIVCLLCLYTRAVHNTGHNAVHNTGHVAHLKSKDLWQAHCHRGRDVWGAFMTGALSGRMMTGTTLDKPGSGSLAAYS